MATMKKKMLLKKGASQKILSMILIFLLVPAIVFSLGLNPPKQKVNYIGAPLGDFSLTLTNTEGIDLNIDVKVSGDLAKYVRLEKDSFVLTDEQKKENIKYSLNLPGYIPPGEYATKIMFLASPISSDGSNVAVTAGVTSKLIVTVPNQGKHIDTDILISKYGDGSQIQFTLPLVNKGTEDIQNIYADIEIFTKDGDKVTKLETSNKRLDINSQAKLTSLLDLENLSDIEHIARAKIYFDGNVIEVEKSFQGGSPRSILKISNISSQLEMANLTTQAPLKSAGISDLVLFAIMIFLVAGILMIINSNSKKRVKKR